MHAVIRNNFFPFILLFKSVLGISHKRVHLDNSLRIEDMSTVSTFTQTNAILVEDKSIQTIDLNPIANVHWNASMPIFKSPSLTSLPSVSTPSDRSSNLYEFLPSTSSDNGSDTENFHPMLQAALSIMKSHPRHYMGINKSCLHVIDQLSKRTKLSETKIMLTLRKIRLNEEFQTLADLFDVDRRKASSYFNESVVPIAKCIKKFMKYAKQWSIRRNLPLSFRRNYFRIGFIIDCFEIQIEKPSKPKKQSKSFSTYKGL